MDLIGNDKNLMFQADIAEPFQFLSGPDARNRIVRTAQKKQLNMLIFNFLFKVRKIDMVTIVLTQIQRIAHNTSASILDDLRKRIVDRLLDQHRIPRFGVRPYCCRQRKHHTRCVDKPLTFHLPVMALTHPPADTLKVGIRGLTVAKDPVFDPFGECILYKRGCLKIHVCHPKRQYILRHFALLRKIIFQTTGVFPVYDLVKIKVSFSHLLTHILHPLLSYKLSSVFTIAEKPVFV